MSRLEPETLEVDADLAAPPATSNEDQSDVSSPVVGTRVGDRVHANARFRGDEHQRDAMGGRPVAVSGKARSELGAAALAWPRLWARQIDLAICWAIAFGLAVLLGAAAVLVGATHLLGTSNIFVKLGVETALGAILILIALIGYETLFLAAFGTTLGKAVLGLRVEPQTGTKIEIGRALRRSLGVIWRGCWAYIGFPVVTLGAWRRSRRILRETGSTPWDDSCTTRVTGGPVPLWRTTLAGVVAITALTIVLGFDAMGKQEMKRDVQQSIDKAYGLSPNRAATVAPSKPFVDPDFGKTSEARGENQAATDPGPSDAVAQFNLGRKYAEGQGVPQDSAKAMQWFHKAAEQGYMPAQGILGVMYLGFQGVTPDYAEAVQWLRKAADQGSAETQYMLGRMYTSGQGVAQGYTEAVNWYRKAADQGYPEAQYNLGGMYATGRGVPQDYAKAVAWFRSAADHDVAGAELALAGMYALGHGVPEDNREAARWTRKAADQGMPEALSVLGGSYAMGLGVPQDYVEALKWYNLAASRFPASQTADRDNAVKLRDDVENKMTPAQIAEAQRLAREWTPKTIASAETR